MKIFAGGIATETNTFCPVATTLEDFQVERGTAVAAGRLTYPSLDLSREWGTLARAHGDEFVFSLMAWAEPGGITQQAAYESLRGELIDDLRSAMPVDIVLLNLHGAMVSEECDDCEEDLIRRVRDIVGDKSVIGVEFDLHCHLSPAKICEADIVITYKEYPHDDVNDRAREVFKLAVATKRGEIRPTMALFDCHMVGMYPTTRPPLREFVDAMTAAETRDRVLSISFAHSFPFSDLPHLGAKVLVVTDGDESLARSIAHEFGSRAYSMRRDIGFDGISLPMEAALRKALERSEMPVVVADQSDNTGAGAPGDSTFVLRWLLEHHVHDVGMAIVFDPAVVAIAKRAGQGAKLRVQLGGKSGPQSGAPVDIEVIVLSIIDNYFHSNPQRSGETRLFPVGDVVALRCGTIDIIVGSQRCQCFSPSIFVDLGIDPTQKRLLVPKSTQHFHAAFAPIARDIIYMAGSGAVPPDPLRLVYKRFDTGRSYPWVLDPLAGESVTAPQNGVGQ